MQDFISKIPSFPSKAKFPFLELPVYQYSEKFFRSKPGRYQQPALCRSCQQAEKYCAG
jgi:hypothetical protein